MGGEWTLLPLCSWFVCFFFGTAIYFWRALLFVGFVERSPAFSLDCVFMASLFSGLCFRITFVLCLRVGFGPVLTVTGGLLINFFPRVVSLSVDFFLSGIWSV